MTKILLGLPVFQAVYPRPLQNFLAMAIAAGHQLSGRCEISVRVQEREALVSAMNTFGSFVLEGGFDALIVADDDCLPPVDAIPKLVAHLEAGRDFVSTVGYMRGYPHTTTIGRYLPQGLSAVQTPYGVDWRGFQWLDNLDGAPDLLEADFCGVPVALISRRCFAQAERPWFGTQLPTGTCTHDIFFAKRLKDIGIPVLVDTTIRCGHLADPAVIDEQTRHVSRKVGQEIVKSHKDAA